MEPKQRLQIDVMAALSLTPSTLIFQLHKSAQMQSYQSK